MENKGLLFIPDISGFTKQFLFRLKEKKHLEVRLRKSMMNLVELVKEIKLPGI